MTQCAMAQPTAEEFIFEVHGDMLAAQLVNVALFLKWIYTVTHLLTRSEEAEIHRLCT